MSHDYEMDIREILIAEIENCTGPLYTLRYDLMSTQELVKLQKRLSLALKK